MGITKDDQVIIRMAYYYKFKGEVNTEHVARVAVERALEIGASALIVASETGRSALKVAKLLRDLNVELKFIVVTHPPDETWGPRGRIPIGLRHPRNAKALKCLESLGAIIVQGTRPLAPPSRSLGWEQSLPEVIIDKVLSILGQGVKIAIEASLMATDAGAVDRGGIVVSLGGTFKGLDTAIVAKTTYSYYFLKEYELLEIIAKPYYPRVKLPEYQDPTWRGNLEQYYEEVTC
ncbi:MAG: hypothetical protein GSR77_05740 [Desulfurococcales archaeon]|nr:hypothetical protein [Desulfurococcales archaeon]